MGSDVTVAILVASAASGGAIAPAGEFGHDAILRADLFSAGSRFLEVATLGTTVVRVHRHGTSAGLGAGATSPGAGVVFSPFAEGAVHRAGLGVTVLGLGKVSGADHTAEGMSGGDGTGSGLLTTGAAESAIAEVGPVTDDAVDGAVEGVTVLRFLAGTAGNAAVVDVILDGPSAGLRTSAASMGAIRVGFPFAHDAILGAGIDFAVVNVCKVGAHVAAVRGVLSDGTGLGLGPSAASLGAFGELTEGRNVAVNGTGAHVARRHGIRSSTGDAAVLRAGGDGTSLGFRTSTTGDGAVAGVSPFGLDAVDGTRLGVARVDVFEFGAGNAAMGGDQFGTGLGLQNSAGTGLAATTASG